ncbi:MAG: hypothetical protein M1401_17115 [Chloroflexi bacterium]|nr:hypothetical protein [Chloroflexota bacterium]MCL5110547.1 hypothetical protein [Chloroflexota bacterium]
MRTFTTLARERGVTTIPVDLRQTADVQPEAELTWVEISPCFWLVGPARCHPEEVAPLVAGALLSGRSAFPKLMSRLLSGEVPQRVGRGHKRQRRLPPQASPMTEEQMVTLGATSPSVRHRRGRE